MDLIKLEEEQTPELEDLREDNKRKLAGAKLKVMEQMIDDFQAFQDR